MTLLDIERLIRRISDALVQGANSDSVPRLAEDYAAVCHAVNLRLQQCEAMIRADDRLQAIQLAETAPNLLGLIRVVEFSKAGDWRAFCQQNSLAVPERIDNRAALALNQCYAQGISTDHPLYAAYRKATLNRNDEEALNALRSIARLNPADANAAAELARVDAKVLAARLEHLGELLAGGDSVLVVTEVEGIESFGFKTRTEGEVWREAALVRCGVLLDEAEKSKAASKWADALTKLELVRRLQKDLSLELSANELQQLEVLEKWTHAEQEKDRVNREFAGLLSELNRRIHESEEKDTSARYVELPEMRADFETLHKVWRALTDFTRPIPEDAAATFRKRSALLEAEIARRMAIRRRTILAGAAVVLLAGAVVVWFVLGEMKARQFARELESAVSHRQTRVAGHLLDTARTGGKNLLRAGAVNVAVGDAESFVAREHELLTNFQTSFAKLPSQPGGETDAARVNALADQLAQTHAALDALSPDLKSENEPRVSAFDRQWQQFVTEAGVAADGRLEQWIGDAEKQCAQLDYRSPIAAATAQLAALSGVVQKINGCEADFTNHVPLRGDLLVRAAAVQDRLAAYERELKKLDDGLASLKQARTFPEFSSAIGLMASSEFSGAPAAKAANAVQSLGTGEEVVLRSLLNATNPATWAFINKTKSPALIPQIAMPAERSFFQQLEADPAISGSHQRYRFWLNPDGTKSVEWITVGALDSSPGWKQIKAWTVSSDATSATFGDHDYGYFNGQWRLSPTQAIYRLDQSANLKGTAAFGVAELGKVWPGEDSYGRPLLQALDAVKDSGEGSPGFPRVSFVPAGGTYGISAGRMGTFFLPLGACRRGADSHYRRRKNRERRLVCSVERKFVEHEARAIFCRRQIRFLRKTGHGQSRARASRGQGRIALRGFCRAGREAGHGGRSNAREVWGYDADGSRPALVSAPAMPLSPLFALAIPRAEYLAKAGVDPNAPSFANGLLPLFRGKN